MLGNVGVPYDAPSLDYLLRESVCRPLQDLSTLHSPLTGSRPPLLSFSSCSIAFLHAPFAPRSSV